MSTKTGIRTLIRRGVRVAALAAEKPALEPLTFQPIPSYILTQAKTIG